MDKIVNLALSKIDGPKEEVRIAIDANKIRELAESIKEQGLIQPIVVRKVGERYEIIAGDRRFRAHEMLGLKNIKSIVKEMDDSECFSVRAIENLQRADLSPIEEGVIYETMRVKYKMSINKIVKALGKSHATILQRLKMLELDDYVQQAVHDKNLSARAAEHLMKIDPGPVRDMYLRSAVENGASLKTCIFWVNEYRRSIEGVEQTPREVEISEHGEPQRESYGSCDICHEPRLRESMRALIVCTDCLKIITSA